MSDLLDELRNESEAIGIAKGKAEERRKFIENMKKGIENGYLNLDVAKNLFELSDDEIDNILKN